jgi:glycine cleavage system H protein
MKYTDSHEWIRLEGNQAVMGISSHAQGEFGEVVYIELPQIGKEIKAGEGVAVIESTKAASDVYSPASGTVIAVNAALKKTPSLINSDPEGEGWLIIVCVKETVDLDRLMDHTQYLQLIS